MASTSGPITVDNTSPDIKYSPQNLWKWNDICGACNVSTVGRDTLRKQAFNSTWQAAPGAQFRPRDMSIDFTFTGSNVLAMFIFFRRTDPRGQTRDDGKSSILLTLDRNSPQRMPLTLQGWTNQELRQQFRMAQLLVDSSIEGNHTLNIQLVRDRSMNVPVTFALDYIQYTPLSTNINTGGSEAPSPSTALEPTTGTEPGPTGTHSAFSTLAESPTVTPSSAPKSGSSQAKTGVGKIVGPIIGLVLAIVVLATLLFCWRQRRLKRHHRLRRTIRAFQPVKPDRYYQDLPFSYYRPESVQVENEKPAVTVLPLYRLAQEAGVEQPPSTLSPPPRRVSIARASLDTDIPTAQPTSRLSVANRSPSNLHH